MAAYFGCRIFRVQPALISSERSTLSRDGRRYSSKACSPSLPRQTAAATLAPTLTERWSRSRPSWRSPASTGRYAIRRGRDRRARHGQRRREGVTTAARVSAMTSSNGRSGATWTRHRPSSPVRSSREWLVKWLENPSKAARILHCRHHSDFGGSPAGSISFEEFLKGQESQSCDCESRASANFATPAREAANDVT